MFYSTQESGVPYAIKVPRSCNSAQELERETIALTSLCHENIVRLYDIQNEVSQMTRNSVNQKNRLQNMPIYETYSSAKHYVEG